MIPIVKLEGQRLRMMIEGTTLHSADKIAAQSIKQAFVVSVLCCRPPPPYSDRIIIFHTIPYKFVKFKVK